MKLQEMLAKLKRRTFNAGPKLHDMDQAGDLLLAAALAISVGVVAMSIASGHGPPPLPVAPGKLVFM